MEMIKDDNNPIYVITDEVEVIGYAFCRTSYPAHTHTMKPAKNLFIDDFCIEEKYRGKHIGKTLFEFLKDEAKRLGYTNILLNVWSCNKDALAFYEKMGLTPRSSIMEYKL